MQPGLWAKAAAAAGAAKTAGAVAGSAGAGSLATDGGKGAGASAGTRTSWDPASQIGAQPPLGYFDPAGSPALLIQPPRGMPGVMAAGEARRCLGSHAVGWPRLP